MKRQLLILSVLTGVLVCTPIQSANAAGGCGHGRGHRSGCGIGFGIGGNNDICGYAELYRELYNNLPYFALHPPVYYSYPVPRTYGYSPFAYPPDVMTPDVVGEMQPLTIDNPFVPKAPAESGDKTPDRSAAAGAQPEPLVVVNPFVTNSAVVAKSDR